MVADVPLDVNCGPHCGTDDKGTRHCRSCHDRATHGNVKRERDEFGTMRWVPWQT